MLSRVADIEGTQVAEMPTSRRRSPRVAPATPTTPSCSSTSTPERGRSFIRSTLRRSRVVEAIIDGWLAAHPEHPALPHLEDAPPSAVANEQAQANASIGATDPGSLADDPLEVAADAVPADEPATA